MRREVNIAGGGLAGLALGVGLCRRGVKVVLHEAQEYPRHRVCGEFIAGLRPGVLSRLGIEECLADASRLKESVWRLREREVYRRCLPEAALGMSRHRLDLRLAQQFEALGGELNTGARVSFDAGRAGWVWATGRQRSESDWIGLKVHCRKMSLAGELELHLGERAYVGLSPVEDGRVNVCGLFRQRSVKADSRIDRLPSYLEASGLGALADRVRAAEPDPISAVGVTALSYASARYDGALRLGDQSGLIAPFTGNGMAQAIESADLALEPIVDYARGDEDWSKAVDRINNRLRRAFARRRMVARWLHPWLLESPRQNVLSVLARRGMLPFGLFFRLTH